jgi:O-antigen/teichoic acid export membrane protein
MGSSGAKAGDRRSDAAALAGGSAWLFGGALLEGVVRWLLTWYLSGALGPTYLGVYSFATTLVTMVGLATPIGVNMGILYFGARWLHVQDRPRLKGYLLGGLATVLVTGPTVALALAAMGASGRFWQDEPGVSEAVLLISPAVALLALVLYLVQALRSAREMMRSTMAFQVVLPVALLGGSYLAITAGFGLEGVVLNFVLANGLALALLVVTIWWRFGALLRDRLVRPIFELKKLLGYSLALVIPDVLYRINLQMDIILLMTLGTAEATGLYRVAVSLVVMVVIPVGAISTMFSPMVAGLYAAGEIGRLDSLLKLATRWLVIIVTPLYLFLVLEHRLILGIYKPEYMANASAILILCAGQAVHAVGAPANRLIPMSGRALLDMGLSLGAVTLNLTLNILLIPRYGGVGAATSGAITFAAWGITRLVLVHRLIGCQPFTGRMVALIAGALGLGALAWFFAPDARLPHLACTAGAIVAFGVLALTVGRTLEDSAMLVQVGGRVQRMLGLRG